MKHLKILSIILILIFFQSKAQQSARVVYKLVKVDDTEKKQEFIKKNGESFYNQMVKFNRKVFSIAKDFDFILKFNPNESLYYWEEEMPDETIDKRIMILAKNMGSGMSVKYQNKKENLIISQGPRPGSTTLYREISKLDKYQWKITNQTDTILGYPVIKAVKNTIEVWFAPDIPVSFGPAGLGGLPGLILKRHLTKQFFGIDLVATEIRFYKKPIKIKRPKKGVLITEEKARAQRIQQINGG